MRIKVIKGVLQVSQGATLELTKEQVRPRAHKLEAVKGSRKGTFLATAPLQFKTGEALGIDAVAKGQLDQVEEIGQADLAA